MEENISKKKMEEMEDDLNSLQMYISDLVKFLPLPFCNVNPVGIIMGINEALMDLLHFSELELVGKEAKELFLDKKEFEKCEKEILNKGKFVKGKEVIIIGKEKKIPVRIFATPRKDELGKSLGYFLIFSDISEIKNLINSLEQKVEERTKNLQESYEEVKKRKDELEKFYHLTVGRELKMVKLKEEIKDLKEQIKILEKKLGE